MKVPWLILGTKELSGLKPEQLFLNRFQSPRWDLLASMTRHWRLVARDGAVPDVMPCPVPVNRASRPTKAFNQFMVPHNFKELFCHIDNAKVTHLLQLTKYFHKKITKKLHFTVSCVFEDQIERTAAQNTKNYPQSWPVKPQNGVKIVKKRPICVQKCTISTPKNAFLGVKFWGHRT